MKERRAFLLLVDLCAVNLAVIAAFAVWSVRGDKDLHDLVFTQGYWFALLSFLWIAFAFVNGLYDLKTAARLSATTRALIQTFALVLFAYLVIFFAAPTELPRGIVVYHGVIAIAFIAAGRGMYVNLARRDAFRRRVLIVGAGKAGRTIARALADMRGHYEIIGFIDDDPAKLGCVIEGIRVIGARANLLTLIHEQRVAQVILAITRGMSNDLFTALLQVQELGIEIAPMPVLYEQMTGRVPVEYIGDNWYVALPLDHAATGGVYPILKRLFDIVVALAGSFCFGLALPFIALAIRLDSPGPIFYTQSRVGQGGRIFSVRKLRTMIVDAERDGQAVWATKNDPRVTRVGKILRKTHLDEFPQLWNILRGEMSAVGPRPERPEFVEQLERRVPFYRLRHAVKPGMAGWAIVNADYVDNLEDARTRVEYDLYYIKHQSLWLDLWILARAVGEVLAFKGR